MDIRKHVFANQIVGKWNVLPDSCMICTTLNDFKTKIKLEMWANAQRDGRPAEYTWRPLFNAAKFG